MIFGREVSVLFRIAYSSIATVGIRTFVDVFTVLDLYILVVLKLWRDGIAVEYLLLAKSLYLYVYGVEKTVNMLCFV